MGNRHLKFQGVFLSLVIGSTEAGGDSWDPGATLLGRWDMLCPLLLPQFSHSAYPVGTELVIPGHQEFGLVRDDPWTGLILMSCDTEACFTPGKIKDI